MIRLSLPFPPSVWDIYVGWGKTRRLSPEYVAWRTHVGHSIRGRNNAEMRRGAQSVEPIAVPFYLSICLKRPNKRQDLDNRIKPILDALQFYGVIKNDNLCERVTATWDHGMREECVVLVMPAEESLAA